MSVPKNTSLQTHEMSLVELGEALIEEAKERSKAEMINKMTAHVQYILQSIDNTNKQLDNFQHRLRVYEGRLAAIKNGNFTVDPLSGIMSYADPDLNTLTIV